MKLLLPIDATSQTTDAVAYLKRFKAALADTPSVVCLHVTYDAPPAGAKNLAEQAREVLREDDLDFGPERIVADLNAAGFAASLQVVEGDTVEQIIKHGAQADLIVMGVHARGRLEQAFTGSVSSRVLAEGNTPVLLVK